MTFCIARPSALVAGKTSTRNSALVGGGAVAPDIQVFSISFVAQAFEQELHRKRRLAGTGRAGDQEQAISREAAAEDVVQAGDAGARVRFSRFGGHDFPS
jgi:hypothetical protein